MTIGLRIDVDTFRGTRYGVPNLCKLFAENFIKASFFFSLGPDNMGRHLWRLLRPSFFRKMLRTKASRLYGWDILLRGTFWQGPIIGEKLGHIIRSTADAGHEIGIHAWDHHAWQSHLEKMNIEDIHRSLSNGIESLTRILGKPPICSAVPGWKCNDLVLQAKEKFAFTYNSDCRGESIFLPIVNGRPLSQPQIPVTVPTYDEVIGHAGVSESEYNEYLLSLFIPDKLHVLTIHAEVEGIACFGLFKKFLNMAQMRACSFVPLGKLLEGSQKIDEAAIVRREVPNREGWICFQSRPATGAH